VVGIRSLSAPQLVAEMELTINALPHTFVLSDKLLEGYDLITQSAGIPLYTYMDLEDD